MNDATYDYKVRCRTCRKKFTVQLFDTHERNLFLVDKKTWFCDACKKQYFKEQTAKQTASQKEGGFPELEGSAKRISWAVKIRGELINKANYLQSSLTFGDKDAKVLSDRAFDQFFKEWQDINQAKWWIDHRNMNVRDISIRIEEIKKEIQ